MGRGHPNLGTETSIYQVPNMQTGRKVWQSGDGTRYSQEWYLLHVSFTLNNIQKILATTDRSYWKQITPVVYMYGVF